jgi:hypothetical protein
MQQPKATRSFFHLLQFLASPCEICGQPTNTGARFSRSTSVLPASTIALTRSVYCVGYRRSRRGPEYPYKVLSVDRRCVHGKWQLYIVSGLPESKSRQAACSSGHQVSWPPAPFLTAHRCRCSSHINCCSHFCTLLMQKIRGWWR